MWFLCLCKFDIAKYELAVCVFRHYGVIWGPQSHTYTSYNNVRNGHLPSACTVACTRLILFANTRGNSDWGMFKTNALYVQSAIWLTLYIMASHCTLNLLFIHHYKAPRFEMGATSQWIMLSLVYLCNLVSVTWTACISTLNTSAGNRTQCRIYWQMKNKSTAQSHHPKQLWRPNTFFSNRCLGLILGTNQPEVEAHHYSIKCGPVVTLPRQSLAHA